MVIKSEINKMKILLSVFLICMIFQSCLFNTNKDIVAEKIDEKDLLEDLQMLKKVITSAHAGAYAYNTEKQLNFLFDSISKSITAPLTIRQFYNKVDFIVDKIKCLHTTTLLPDIYYDSIYERRMFFPLPLMAIGEKLYVNSELFNIELGAEILSINQHSAKEIITRIKAYSHTDGNSKSTRNQAIENEFALNNYLLYGASPAFNIRYRDSSDNINTVSLNAEKLSKIFKDQSEDTYFSYPTDAPYDLEIFDYSSTALLTVRSFNFETNSTAGAYVHFLENSFRIIEQNDIKNLIIDCRNNGGGYYSYTFPLLNYLVNEKLKEFDSSTMRFNTLPYANNVALEDTALIVDIDTSMKFYDKTVNGLFKRKDTEIEYWEPKDFVFKGKLFVVINGQVASAASTFAAILKDKTNAILIGEETSGGYFAHNAKKVTYLLPNSKIKVAVPVERYYQPVKEKKLGRGVLPQKEIKFTLEALKTNTDLEINYILDSMINKN